MAGSVDICSVGVYHPENVVYNDFYVNKYKKQGKDIKELLETFGRQSRFISDDEDENTVTMAAKACEKALDRAGLKATDIDLLIFSSGTPEYLAPANAIKVHQLIGGKDSVIAYDMNANCVGMIIAVEQASRYMLSSDSIRYALVVGSEQMNRYSQNDDEFTKSNFGDAACAVVLQKNGNEVSGFQDAVYHLNSSRSSVMLFPKCGMSHAYEKELPAEEKKILWTGGYADNGFVLAKALIESVLNKKSRQVGEIRRFFISQVCRENMKKLASSLEVKPELFEYIGDKYGYTGTSSPFVALNNAIEHKKINRGDDIMFWSVGTGYISCAMLWKY